MLNRNYCSLENSLVFFYITKVNKY